MLRGINTFEQRQTLVNRRGLAVLRGTNTCKQGQILVSREGISRLMKKGWLQLKDREMSCTVWYS